MYIATLRGLHFRAQPTYFDGNFVCVYYIASLWGLHFRAQPTIHPKHNPTCATSIATCHPHQNIPAQNKDNTKPFVKTQTQQKHNPQNHHPIPPHIPRIDDVAANKFQNPAEIPPPLQTKILIPSKSLFPSYSYPYPLSPPSIPTVSYSHFAPQNPNPKRKRSRPHFALIFADSIDFGLIFNRSARFLAVWRRWREESRRLARRSPARASKLTFFCLDLSVFLVDLGFNWGFFGRIEGWRLKKRRRKWRRGKIRTSQREHQALSSFSCNHRSRWVFCWFFKSFLLIFFFCGFWWF